MPETLMELFVKYIFFGFVLSTILHIVASLACHETWASQRPLTGAYEWVRYE